MSLSERIAALNARSNQHPSPNSSPKAVTRAGVSVKDKAARFDGIGIAPAPRGSFGLGAPPNANSQKRTNEMYGNRISSVGSNTLGAGRSGLQSGLHSRASSISSARSSSRAGDHMELDDSPDPLTREAVQSLGAAKFLDPGAADREFQSAAPSEVDMHDATSSIAVEMDDVDAAMPSGSDGRASPALTHSTVSDSAMREAPPVLTPGISSMSVMSLAASQDAASAVATQASTSTAPVPTTIPTLNTPDMDSSDQLQGHSLQLSESQESTATEVPGEPLPLSQRLVESLDSSDPSLTSANIPPSVLVGTGSDGEREDVGNKLLPTLFTNDDRAVNEAVTGPSGEPIEVDLTSENGDSAVQPNLQISAPVLPLSSSHLRSLNLQPALSRSVSTMTGFDTPRSTWVEDGSVDGRSVGEVEEDAAFNVDEEYIETSGPNEMDPLPVPSIGLTPVDANPTSEITSVHSTVSPPQSPAVLAYDPSLDPLTPKQALSPRDAEALSKIGHLVVSQPLSMDEMSPIDSSTSHPTIQLSSLDPDTTLEVHTPLATQRSLPPLSTPQASASDPTSVTPRSEEVEAIKPAEGEKMDVEKNTQESANTLDAGAFASPRSADGMEVDFPLPKFSVSHNIGTN